MHPFNRKDLSYLYLLWVCLVILVHCVYTYIYAHCYNHCIFHCIFHVSGGQSLVMNNIRISVSQWRTGLQEVVLASIKSHAYAFNIILSACKLD